MRAVLLALLCCTACGGSPTVPTPPVTTPLVVTPPVVTLPAPLSLTGTWDGATSIDECQGDLAFDYFCTPGYFTRGTRLIFRLTATQAGARVSGHLRLSNAEGDVSGTIDDAGAVTLAGPLTQVTNGVTFQMALEHFEGQTRIDAAGPSLFVYNLQARVTLAGAPGSGWFQAAGIIPRTSQ